MIRETAVDLEQSIAFLGQAGHQQVPRYLAFYGVRYAFECPLGLVAIGADSFDRGLVRWLRLLCPACWTNLRTDTDIQKRIRFVVRVWSTARFPRPHAVFDPFGRKMRTSIDRSVTITGHSVRFSTISDSVRSLFFSELSPSHHFRNSQLPLFATSFAS